MLVTRWPPSRCCCGGNRTAAARAQIALLLVAAMLPIVILAPVAGRPADRCDSRLLLVSASLAQAAACAVLVFTTAPVAVLALVAALAAGQAFTGTTWQALLPAISGPENLTRAVGLSQAATTVAGIAAPALAGVLTGAFGARIPLLIDTATFLAITVAALLVSTRRGTAQPSDSAQSGGFALIWRDPLLRVLVLMLAVFITLGAMVNVVEVFLVRSTFGASATWYGVLGAVWAWGCSRERCVAGRLPQRRLAFGAVIGTVGLSVGLLGYAAAPASGGCCRRASSVASPTGRSTSPASRWWRCARPKPTAAGSWPA